MSSNYGVPEPSVDQTQWGDVRSRSGDLRDLPFVETRFTRWMGVLTVGGLLAFVGCLMAAAVPPTPGPWWMWLILAALVFMTSATASAAAEDARGVEARRVAAHPGTCPATHGGEWRCLLAAGHATGKHYYVRTEKKP